MELNERTEESKRNDSYWKLRSCLDEYDCSSEGSLPLARLLLGEERCLGQRMYGQELQRKL